MSTHRKSKVLLELCIHAWALRVCVKSAFMYVGLRACMKNRPYIADRQDRAVSRDWDREWYIYIYIYIYIYLHTYIQTHTQTIDREREREKGRETKKAAIYIHTHREAGTKRVAAWLFCLRCLFVFCVSIPTNMFFCVLLSEWLLAIIPHRFPVILKKRMNAGISSPFCPSRWKLRLLKKKICSPFLLYMYVSIYVYILHVLLWTLTQNQTILLDRIRID